MLEDQTQRQDLKDSVWRFGKVKFMTIFFYKFGELIRSSFVKTPLRFSAILIFQIIGYICFLWSILAYFHPIADRKNGHATRVLKYRRYLNDLNFNGFVFSNGLNCSVTHKFERFNKLSKNILDLSFYQDQNK